MNEKHKFKFGWLEKIKNVKHIEIYIVVIFIIIIFLIYGSTFKSKKSNTQTKDNEVQELTINSYVESLEDSLEQTLSKVKGVSNVKVLITLDLKNAVVENNVVKTDSFPSIKGILIVASGVENTQVKLNVLKAVEAVIEVNTGCIEILSSN